MQNFTSFFAEKR